MAEPDARQAGKAGARPAIPQAGMTGSCWHRCCRPASRWRGCCGRAQFFAPGEPPSDFREVHRKGGRGAEEFYRERWRHDKVVRSTHGVNCTGSCSWKVYVKDGIITWETQQTDYPSTGPDSPEYEPRGCPRGASFSWYTYSPSRVATRTCAASCSISGARPGPGWAIRWPRGRRSPRIRSAPRGTRTPGGWAGSSGRPGRRSVS